MGYDAYSYAVFGVKTARSNIKQKVKVRACHHAIADGMKFCPECGKHAFVEKEENILDGMDDKKLSYFYSDYNGNADVVLGFCVGRTSYRNNTEPVECYPPTPRMAVEILEFCKEHNLPYTEKNLKMYVLTEHSY